MSYAHEKKVKTVTLKQQYVTAFFLEQQLQNHVQRPRVQVRLWPFAACQALSYITEHPPPYSTARPFSIEALKLWNRLTFQIRTAEFLQIFRARLESVCVYVTMAALNWREERVYKDGAGRDTKTGAG